MLFTSARRSPLAAPKSPTWPGPLRMARDDVCASSMTGFWGSITSSPNARCAGVPSSGETGCSPVRRRAAGALQRSIRSSRSERPMAATRRPTSLTSLGRSQLIAQRRDGTSTCLQTGLSKPQSQWGRLHNLRFAGHAHIAGKVTYPHFKKNPDICSASMKN